MIDTNEKNIEEIRKIKDQEEIDLIFNEINAGETLIDEKPVKFEEKTIFNEKILIKLPEDFSNMKEEYVKIKYPSENRPKVIISDEDGMISFMFNVINVKVMENDIAEFKDRMKSMLANSNGSIIFNENSIIEISGKKSGYLEFFSPGLDTDVYNLMYFISFEEKVLLIGFNCAKELSNIWKNSAKAAIKTVILKEEI